MVAHKARLTILGKTDLASREQTKAWKKWFAEQNQPCYAIHHQQKQSFKQLAGIMLEVARQDPRSRFGRLKYKRAMRAMVVGTPNVGKSTLINTLAGGRRAQTGAKPGVTRSQQWVLIGKDIELLDTPGIMYPNIQSPEAGLKLGLCALLKDKIVPDDLLCEYLLFQVKQQERLDLLGAYDLVDYPETVSDMLQQIGTRLGVLSPGGEVDVIQTARRIVHDYQHGKLGAISFESPETFLAEQAAIADAED